MVEALSANFSNSTNSTNKNPNTPVFLFILPLICVIIFLGNLLVLLTIRSFNVRRVPDLLIGSLALVDLINDLVPVLLSLVIFFINPNGFNGLKLHPLCEFYNWVSSFLRLAASFITTAMSLDRLYATLWPLFYRTKVTPTATLKVILGIIVTSAFIAAWPAMGWGRVYPHVAICSFDFGGSYGYVIACLGYTQLIIVMSCFIAVTRTMKKLRTRLDALKEGKTVVLIAGKLQVEGESSTRRGNQVNRSERPKVESRHSKESRLFVKIMGIVVLLFYVSWMPIILSITLELITQKQNDSLQSLSAQMSIFSSLLNPFIYCIMCAPYRRGYIYVIRKAFTVCGCPEPTRERPGALTAVVAPSMTHGNQSRLHSNQTTRHF